MALCQAGFRKFLRERLAALQCGAVRRCACDIDTVCDARHKLLALRNHRNKNWFSNYRDRLTLKLLVFSGVRYTCLELGHGFCFEARQKRILIGDGHYFIDLVFYHRILKCHVLVELKLAEFNH